MNKKSVLREALRVITSEELTSISKGLLYSTDRNKSLQEEHHSPLEVDHSDQSRVETKKKQPSPGVGGPLKESSSVEGPKLAIHIPTGSTESESKLVDELEDILGRKESPEDYSHLPSTASKSEEVTEKAIRHSRPTQSHKSLSAHIRPTIH